MVHVVVHTYCWFRSKSCGWRWNRELGKGRQPGGVGEIGELWLNSKPYNHDSQTRQGDAKELPFAFASAARWLTAFPVFPYRFVVVVAVVAYVVVVAVLLLCCCVCCFVSCLKFVIILK